MICPSCKTNFRGKICPCGWTADKVSKRDEIARCPRCSVMTRSKYLKSYGTEEICSDCMTIAQYDPSDREYYKTLANKYQLKLYDIQTHIDAANKLNQTIDDYLAKLPRTPEQFMEYFKNTVNAGMAETIIKGAI